MATTIRSELSEKNEYWIEKHRYYELRHFCLQYPIWKKAYNSIDGMSKRSVDLTTRSKNNLINSPTDKCVDALLFYSDRMKLVEQAAIETDPILHSYILNAVTCGVSYNHLKTKLEIPCCKDVYYKLYRRFFWILNKTRN